VLSGGEKSRLSLARLLLTPSNLLILDEPTNHLDMQSKDILKNALLQFDGTLIIVSHDRDFLQGLTNKVFEFRDQKIKEHLGDIYDFLEYRRLKNLKELEIKNQQGSENENAASENKLSYERKKQQDREIRKLSNQIDKVEENIHKLELEISNKDAILSNPSGHPDINFDALSIEYNQLNQKLENEMNTWEELHSKLEELKGSMG
jgi:ATP-binding cassette subfamily F protein 3